MFLQTQAFRANGTVHDTLGLVTESQKVGFSNWAIPLLTRQPCTPSSQDGEPKQPKQNSQEGNWEADAEVIPEADVDVRFG